MQLRGIGANVGEPTVKVSIFIAGIAILAALLLATLAIEAPAQTVQFKTFGPGGVPQATEKLIRITAD
jgi:hypothetical protein